MEAASGVIAPVIRAVGPSGQCPRPLTPVVGRLDGGGVVRRVTAWLTRRGASAAEAPEGPSRASREAHSRTGGPGRTAVHPSRPPSSARAYCSPVPHPSPRWGDDVRSSSATSRTRASAGCPRRAVGLQSGSLLGRAGRYLSASVTIGRRRSQPRGKGGQRNSHLDHAGVGAGRDRRVEARGDQPVVPGAAGLGVDEFSPMASPCSRSVAVRSTRSPDAGSRRCDGRREAAYGPPQGAA